MAKRTRKETTCSPVLKRTISFSLQFGDTCICNKQNCYYPYLFLQGRDKQHKVEINRQVIWLKAIHYVLHHLLVVLLWPASRRYCSVCTFPSLFIYTLIYAHGNKYTRRNSNLDFDWSANYGLKRKVFFKKGKRDHWKNVKSFANTLKKLEQFNFLCNTAILYVFIFLDIPLNLAELPLGQHCKYYGWQVNIPYRKLKNFYRTYLYLAWLIELFCSFTITISTLPVYNIVYSCIILYMWTSHFL